ncbi:MAG: PepSY-associated TM helix domain-containing protein [Pseudomonadota bacterium]
MNRERHLRNYGLHSWSGMVLGLFVYVVCFTGSIALFAHEITSWEDPAKRLAIPEQPIAIDATFTSWLGELEDLGEVEFARIVPPHTMEPFFEGGATVHLKDSDVHEFITRKWNPVTGDILPERGEALSVWLLDFHRDLMWPQGLGGRTIGRTIVGIAGVILMLSILTGVIAHTKIVREFFTLRYQRSVRLKWQDTHKVLGLWGLPFYTMIAFTGAVLGVVAILAPLVALLTFKGDQQALINEVIGEPVEASGVPAEMLNIDSLLATTHPETGKELAFINFNNFGDQNARYDLFFVPNTKLMSYEAVQIDGVTGDIIPDASVSAETPGNRAVAMLSPLHYGTFGGMALKLLYLALGLSLAVITVFGLMMWIERRLHGNEGSKSEVFYRRLSHMVAGASMGLPVATIAIFHLDKLYWGAEASRMIWTGWTYMIVWALGLAYAFVRKNDYTTTRELLGLTGVLMIGAAILNTIMTGDTVLNLLTDQHKASAWVDASLMIGGALTAAVALKLPSVRQEEKKKTKVKAITTPDVLLEGVAE